MSGPLTIRTPPGVTHVGSTALMTIIRGTHDKFYVGHVGFNKSTKEWWGWGQNGRNNTNGAIQVPKSFSNARGAVNYVNGVITKKYDKDGYDLEQDSSFSLPNHPTFNGAATQQLEAKAAQLGLINAPAQAAPAPAAPAGQTAAEKAKAKKAAEAKKAAAEAKKKAAASARAAKRPTLSSMDALVAAAAQQHVSPVSMLLGDDDD